MPGMHGNATAITAMQKSDLLINLGARFDDRITGKVRIAGGPAVAAAIVGFPPPHPRLGHTARDVNVSTCRFQ